MSAYGQPTTVSDTTGVSRIEYTRLDQITKDQNQFLSGERSEISFYFIEIHNLTTDEAIQGVEVTISSREQTVVGSSIGLAAIGSLWGASADVTLRRIENSGHILLDAEEVRTVVTFLRDIMGALGQSQDRFKVYRIALQDRFELGMLYDPSYTPQSSEGQKPHPMREWQFTITAGGVTHTLDFQDGLEMVQALTRWSDQMQEGTSEAASN